MIISSYNKRLAYVFLATIALLFITDMCVAESEPDNAALLYYQALLAQPDFDYGLIYEVLDGAEPNEAIKKYIQSCDKKIKLAESASKISQCNWGVLNTQPFYLIGDLYHLSRLISAKAIILASDGKYKAALDECITVQRLASHIENYKTITAHNLSLQIRNISFVGIQGILGSMPPDEEILIWLQAQLSAQCRDISITSAMENERDIAIEYLKTDAEPIERWKLQAAILLGLPYDEKQATDIDPTYMEDFKEWKKMQYLSDEELKKAMQEGLDERFVISDEDIKEFRDMFNYTEETKKEVQDLLAKPEEELLEHARKSYDKYLYQKIRIIESELPYDQKYKELENLNNQMGQDIFDVSNLLYETAISINLDVFRIQVRYKTHFNILKSAIEIYLVKAKTGKLPEKLPEYLPKDPLCGRDFIYEITGEGFSLKSSVDINTRNNIHLEFKVTDK